MQRIDLKNSHKKFIKTCTKLPYKLYIRQKAYVPRPSKKAIQVPTLKYTLLILDIEDNIDTRNLWGFDIANNAINHFPDHRLRIFVEGVGHEFLVLLHAG